MCTLALDSHAAPLGKWTKGLQVFFELKHAKTLPCASYRLMLEKMPITVEIPSCSSQVSESFTTRKLVRTMAKCVMYDYTVPFLQ
jgi:hypothetical protein